MDTRSLYLEGIWKEMVLNSHRDKPVFMGYSRRRTIIGVTEAPGSGYSYELGEKVDPFILAEGTRMGHIHLSVSDSRAGEPLIKKVLG